jgi:microcystin degradation protein MlrC
MTGLRIAVGGLVHETNTFAPTPTTLADFDTHGSSLPILRGDALLTAFPDGGGSIGGVIRALQAAPVRILPLVWAAAQPGGIVTAAAFQTLTDELLLGLKHSGPLDAVVLDLHGAMVVDGIEDAEGWLLRRIRQAVGDASFIAAVLDFHGNVSAEMMRYSDLLVAYRTYPHVDMEDSGARLVHQTLHWLKRGTRPAKAFAQGAYLIPIHAQSTLMDPMLALVAVQELAERQYGAVASLLPGFPPADIHDCGPSVLAYAPDQARADAALGLVTDALAAAEPAFAAIGLRQGAQAVVHALRRSQAGAQPVILVDTQDNPGAGATSDTMGLVQELLRQGAPDAVVAVIQDPEAAARAHAAGIGAGLPLVLGGKGSSAEAGPLVARFQVEALGDGRFAGSGAYYNNAPLNFGPMALLRIEGSAVRVIVGSQRAQAGTQAIFRHLGIDPGKVGIIGLKSSVHFLADFGGLTSEIHYAAFPGLNTADPGAFAYRNIRPTVRRRAKA